MSYQEKTNIGGVLLTAGQTFGRLKDKLLYKCLPDDTNLPSFFIPFAEKTLAFHKYKTNKYVSFRIKETGPADKRPIGLLTNIFGDTDDMDAYVQYRLSCKELSPSLNKLKALVEKINQPLPTAGLEDRRDWPIMSIDPPGCKDIDDAVGLRPLKAGETLLSIYIANVPLMLDHYGLWPALTDRISTIYFPNDNKLPMLPPDLSEDKCSLRQGEDRLAFALDVTINNNNCVVDIQTKSVLINVAHNYAYETAELLDLPAYQALWALITKLNQAHEPYVAEVNDSHAVVEYCMILMNHECAKRLQAKQTGIFRAATASACASAPAASAAPSALNAILQNVVGEYTSFADRKPHELLKLDCYTHITSPIRRLVDCLNMLELQDMPAHAQAGAPAQAPAHAQAFLAKWLKSIPIINEKTRAIRKLQNEMELWALYQANPTQTYSGVVFAKQMQEMLYKYRVYLPDLKLLTSIKSSTAYADYTGLNFSVHLFLDEAKMLKKIRLQIV
jgi:exoribonuclease R